jgi:hypothetical protein
MVNASTVERTTWKSKGLAVSQTLRVLIKADNEESNINFPLTII